jgi:hypothetical protein
VSYKFAQHQSTLQACQQNKKLIFVLKITIENLASSCIDIYKVNKTKKCKEPLEAIYSKLTCGIHRKGIIEVLIDNKVFSDKIKQEIKYDSYEEA